MEDWKAILGQGVSVGTAEFMNRSRAEQAQAYRVMQPLPPAAEEAELLVLAGNGEGVIMGRPLAEEMREAGEATRAMVAASPRRRRPSPIAHRASLPENDRLRKLRENRTSLFPPRRRLGMEAKKKEFGKEEEEDRERGQDIFREPSRTHLLGQVPGRRLSDWLWPRRGGLSAHGQGSA